MSYSIRLLFDDPAPVPIGHSKWWGAPDLPQGTPYPVVPCSEDDDSWDEPLTFLCQIRCQDIAALDPQGLLPHEGMLYFFAAIDYFLGLDSPIFTPLGEWEQRNVRVMYLPTCDNLEPYEMHYDDGSDVFFPPQALTFESCDAHADGFKLLGKPYLAEICEQYPDTVSLLQIDEEDSWNLRFYDCGMLHLLISPQDLAARRWPYVFGHLFSF